MTSHLMPNKFNDNMPPLTLAYVRHTLDAYYERYTHLLNSKAFTF
jgi:hypothetical protein